MAVTFGTPTVQSLSVDATNPTVAHTAGGDALLVFFACKANETVSSVTWSRGGGQALTQIGSSPHNDGSASSTLAELTVWAIMNPDPGAGTVNFATNVVDDFYWAVVVDVSGVDTGAAITAAIIERTTDYNNSVQTNQAVHAESGTAGNKLVIAGIGLGDDTSPWTESTAYTDLANGNTAGGSNAALDASYYVAQCDAPEAITATLGATAANVSVVLEIIAAAAATFNGTPTVTPTEDGYDIDFEIQGSGDTVSAVAVLKDSAAPSAAQIHAGQNGAGGAALAADNVIAVVGVPGTLNLTGLDFPIHDVYVAVDTNVEAFVDETKTPPAGFQYVTINVPPPVGAESILDGASPAAVDGDIIECSTHVNSIQAGADAYVLTMDVDGTFLVDPGDDETRLDFLARFYDVSVGDWSDDPAVTFYINNLPPQLGDEGLLIELYEDVAMTPITLATRWSDPEGDVITAAFQDALPDGLSVTDGVLSGTPTTVADSVVTERGTDALGDFTDEEVTISVLDTIAMPDVDDGDVSEAAAIAAIEGAGLTSPIVFTNPSETVDSGNVISQTPAAGTLILATDETTITVSTGDGAVLTGGQRGLALTLYHPFYSRP